ncbi:xanthine/uracil/vitamin C permease [Inediibacterium massiliense]|uniref:xanthine/uracil/vitamin C permease n=1 Tax=Inediibacterium massiliense TaxID=1658111 RepID=UPI0006B4520D|nr:xanthine/uracil/vitamin C permease [Inediibacterium massiliense]
MIKTEKRLTWFNRGDIGGLTYILTNNIVNYIIVIATLSGVLGWPDKIVYGRVIPGMSMGLLVSCLYYAYTAYKLSKKEGRTDVTALPSGVSTPAMFVILYGVIMPLHYSINDPELAWSAAVAACFIGGVIEFCGGFIGPWLKKRIPRAALLGTVAGIGFIWMATQGVFDLFGDPIIGLPVLLVGMIGVFGGYLFPKRIPPFAVAIVGGIVYALAIGRTHIDFSGIGFYVPNPVNSIEALINGFAIVIPYLTIIIPIEIYNFIETMDNVEAANAAGDNYSVRDTQFADGICTMISALFGGVVPNTVWLGHAGLKKAGANIGFSWVGGILLAIAGVFGLFTFFSALIPPAIAAITYLWCSIVMLSQAFRVCDEKHYAGIGIAMVPPIADFLFTQVTGAVGLSDIWTETLSSGVVGYGTEVTQRLAASGVMWNGVAEVKAGAIIIGILLGTLTVFIIDRQLDKAGLTALAGAVLSLFGFIHSASLGIFFKSTFMIGYLIMAAICFILHLGKGKWFDVPDDFDYV